MILGQETGLIVNDDVACRQNIGNIKQTKTTLSKQRQHDSYKGKVEYKQVAPSSQYCSAGPLSTQWAVRKTGKFFMQ